MRSAIPKVVDAAALWSRYPTEIEADLRLRGIDIRDWHQGNTDSRGCLLLSSRLLLSLVYRLPETSDFKTNAPAPLGRDGNWTELQRIVAHLSNELSAYRASKYAGTPHEYQYTMFLDPVERRERAEEQEAENNFQDSEFEKLLSQFD